MERRYLKAINFDLDTHKLQAHYPGANYRTAYYYLRHFFQKHGFEHRQGSGYISLTKLATADIYDLMDALTQALPWIGDCVSKIDVTNIGQQHDLIDLVRTEPLDLNPELLLQEPTE